MTHSASFACPRCLGPLTATPTALSCATCSQTFPYSNGVPNFGVKSDYYYGEFPQPEMQSLVDTAVREGSVRAFDHALRDKTEEWRHYFRHYATDETRAAWQFLLHLPENASVLDIGCGWGNLSLSLARNFAAVYALDIMPERAVIASIRAREAGLPNVTALAGGNAPHLPFPDESLDVVVLNGVLEWVPVSYPNVSDPREAQLRLLRDIVRVLKPDGQLYVGIENRIGYGYFLGKPDEHSRLKFATLLPRSWANRYSRAKRHEPYRTYTYTWRGYRQLLRDAGFANSRFYCPFPEYREFNELIDLDDPQNLARALQPTSFLGRLGMQLCKRVNVFREFAPSYSIVASKIHGSDRFIDRLLHHVNVSASDDGHLRVTRTAATLLFTPNAVIRLPLTERARQRMDIEADNLRALRSEPQPLVPDLITEGRFQRQSYLVTRALPGVPGATLARRPRNLPAILRQAAEFITEFHRKTSVEHTGSDEWLQQNFDWLVDYVATLGPDIAELKTQIRHDLLGSRVLTVTAHGDFSLQNLLFDPRSQRLTGVVDWDLTDTNGWPGRDLLHLFAAREYEARGGIFNEAVLAALKRLRDNPGLERDLFSSYLTALNPEPEQVVWAVQRYLLRNIFDKHEYGDKQIAPLIANLPADLATARLLTQECIAIARSTAPKVRPKDVRVPPARLQELAQELGDYTGEPVDHVAARLKEELHELGGRIAAEWKRKRPVTSGQIQQFYQETDAYLYELLIDGESPFRAQTREAILHALRAVNAHRVFEFGGGIGTDALWFTGVGLEWTYYDLPGGQTSRFAAWRFRKRQLPVTVATHPGQTQAHDAAVSVEVFEHVPNLLNTLQAINRALRPGGLLIFTESFGKTEQHPLHLTRTAMQGRFLNELVRAAGFDPVLRFGPGDSLYRTTKCRESTAFDWLRAAGLICGRVVRKAPVKLWRTLSPRAATDQAKCKTC
ncbi:MAG TPA: methyltransferase domain-containing protein [Verrucomicrobiae bacterium]|nr:methyltransferase domain-containing protein [Verrucomicrobiae bacterium]